MNYGSKEQCLANIYFITFYRGVLIIVNKMISLKDILIQVYEESLMEKVGYSPSSAPDSITSRTMGARKALKKDTGGNDQQANGADIAKKMDFDKFEPHSINDKEPIDMMTTIYQMWSGREDEGDF